LTRLLRLLAVISGLRQNLVGDVADPALLMRAKAQ